MGHPVAHGRDLLDAVNDAPLALHHLVQDHIKSVLVGEQVRRFFHLVAIRRFIAVFAVDADPFADALAEDRFIFHANQLVLQRRAARVDHQNVHKCFVSLKSVDRGRRRRGLDTGICI